MSSPHTKLVDYALIAIPPPPARFTLQEWNLHNKFRTRTCLDQQRLADSTRAEADRVIGYVNEITDLNKRDVDHKLDEKIKDIEFNKGEIERQRKEVCIEIENLNVYMERIKDCLSSLRQNALATVRKCLILREGRLGIDLCYDEVEKEMKAELAVIEGVEVMLVRTLEQANEQVRRLRSSMYFMDRDLEDKHNVLKIDTHNSNLTNTSMNLSIYHGLTPLDPANITEQEWERFTVENIQKSAKEINAARQLRSYVNILLGQAISDLKTQFHAVNNAFRRRIEQLKEIKMKMEVQHSEIMRQANEMTRTTTKLEKAISEKEGYMALAHTRLGNRAQRPGMELCKDKPELNLVKEVGELRKNLSVLQLKTAEAQASLRYLLKTQIQLEEDINIKTNSIKIDEVDCMTLRQRMDYQAF